MAESNLEILFGSGEEAINVERMINFIDTEQIILEVQSHALLWDVTHELYKDRDARQAAWLDICEKLFKTFELDEKQKDYLVKKIQGRWKSARNSYTKVKANNKNIRSGLAVKKMKKYVHYNMMTFLDSGNEAEDTVESCQDDFDDSSSTNTENYDDPLPGTSESPSHEYRHTSQAKKRKISKSPTPFEKELLKTVKQSGVDEKDEDMSFFISLLPTVRKFPTYKKLRFRAQVLQYLIEIEKENVITVNEIPMIKRE